MKKDSASYTILVAAALCLVCSIIVSAAAVGLKPLQQANKVEDRKRNILSVVGLIEEGQSVEEAFKQVEVVVVDLESGKYNTELDAETYDQRKASDDPALSTSLTTEQDIAGIGSRANAATVYLVRNPDESIRYVILPVHGYGLWSTLYGFLALKGDANTVVGLSFYDHAETPGLGGEVDNPNWKALWPGKVAFDANGEAKLGLVKGAIDTSKPEAKHQVDTLSGATLTSRGVTNLIQFWLGSDGFGSYLKRLQAEG